MPVDANAGKSAEITKRHGRCPTCGAKQRSNEEHRILFGVITLAFENWPETHKFKPDDADHLRSWLLVEAKHCETFEVPNVISTEPKAIANLGKFFCAGKRHFRLKQVGDGIVIVRPKSIAKENCPTPVFRSIASAVYEIIESITGITPDIYKRERHKAA